MVIFPTTSPFKGPRMNAKQARKMTEQNIGTNLPENILKAIDVAIKERQFTTAVDGYSIFDSVVGELQSLGYEVKSDSSNGKRIRLFW